MEQNYPIIEFPYHHACNINNNLKEKEIVAICWIKLISLLNAKFFALAQRFVLFSIF